MNHSFSSLNSSSGFAGGKHYQKITTPIFILVLQNFAIPDCFPYFLFYRYLFSLLSSGWFVIIQRNCWGVYWFHSVRPSVRLSVPRPSRVRPASHVHSVAPTVLVGSISYLHILSSNSRRCVACQVFLQNFKILIFGNFFKYVTLTSCLDSGSNVNH